VDDDVIRNVECIIELPMVRDSMLQLSSDVFSFMDIRDVISFLCAG